MDNPESITVIRAQGRRLAKLIRPDGSVEGYDDAKHFDLFAVVVEDLAALDRLLHRLLGREDCAVVRGAIIDPLRARRVRRLANLDAQTGEAPTLADVPRRWLALDIEGVDRPHDVPAADLPRCATEVIRRLPSPFRDARCLVQATASHGIKSDCRLRLWYWLDRPTHGLELKRWLRGTPADPSVFRTVQPIYTASAIFQRGADDPLPERLVIRDGEEMVAVPSRAELAPPPRLMRALPDTTGRGVNRYAWAALRNATSRIRCADVGQRHDTILSETRRLAQFVAAGLLRERDVSDAVQGAGEEAGKPTDEIASVIAWAFAHPSEKALPEGVVS
jgi:hypothetical protein